MTLKPFFVILFLSAFATRVAGQEIGVQLGSLHHDLQANVQARMAQLKQLGIRNIEMNGTFGLSFPDFIKLVAANDLNVVSFGTNLEILKKYPQLVADEARSYGARYVVCYGPGRAAPSLSAAEAERLVVELNTAGKVLSRNGLLLCYQPNGTEFGSTENGRVFDLIAAGLDTRFAHFQMDVLQLSEAGENPVELLKQYPTRWVLVHLRDGKRNHNAAGASEGSRTVPLGRGDVGITQVLKAATDLGIRYFFIEEDSARAAEQIPVSLAFLENFAAQSRK